MTALAFGSAVFSVTLALAARLRATAQPVVWALPTVLGLVVGAGVALVPHRSNPVRETATADTPSILLVTIDTLRADHVRAYAAGRTPTFDGLAAHGYLFEQVIAPSILTGPSHTSILSGTRVATHGVTENSQRIPAGLQTLAEIMGGHGLQTAAFVGGQPVTTAASGLPSRFAHRGEDFRTFRALPELAYRTTLGQALPRLLARPDRPFRPFSRPADDVTREAVDWLSHAASPPFFAWVHYYDPHLPYDPPSRLLPAEAVNYRGPAVPDWYQAEAPQRAAIIQSAQAMQQMMRLYDAEVAFADEQLGQLVAAARTRAGPAGAWIVVTSDHGESFGEHGIYFARDLYDDSVRVPLVIVPPVPLASGIRVKPQVRLIDVAPTLCDLLGWRPPRGMDGVSLKPILHGQPLPPIQAISLIVPTRTDPYGRVHISLRTDEWKAILRAPGWVTDLRWVAQSRELFDLVHDAAELKNIAAEREVGVWSALEAAAARQDPHPAPGVLSKDELEMLRSLGYLR